MEGFKLSGSRIRLDIAEEVRKGRPCAKVRLTGLSRSGIGLEPFGRTGRLERRSLRKLACQSFWVREDASGLVAEEAKNFNGELLPEGFGG